MRRLLLVFLLAAAGSAFGQAWPNKPVRVIIPYPPGGGAEAYGKVGHEPISSTPEAVRARVATEEKAFAKAVKDAKVKPE